jgi:Family of unknown function (DUF5681)
MPFRPGKSGNPAGKRKGSRNHVLLALDRIGGEAAEEVLQAAVTAARGGDMRAAELILSRCWPARKGRPLALNLPPLSSAGDLRAAVAAVVAEVTAGRLTPDEGTAVVALIEIQRRAIETVELEARIAALEAQDGERVD